VANTFRDLVVWKKSMDLAVQIYRLTGDFPREEMYGLTGQMRRCAVSIPSNIAEGQGRASFAEFRQCIAVARGLNCELQTQLALARTLGFGDQDRIKNAEELSEEIRKMLFGLLGSLRARKTEPRTLN
jgi:four helix bundle protein